MIRGRLWQYFWRQSWVRDGKFFIERFWPREHPYETMFKVWLPSHVLLSFFLVHFNVLPTHLYPNQQGTVCSFLSHLTFYRFILPFMTLSIFWPLKLHFESQQ